MISYKLSNLVISFVVLSLTLAEDGPCDDLKKLFKGEYTCLSNKELREEQFGNFYSIEHEASKKKYYLKHSDIEEDPENFDTNILEEAFEKVKAAPYVYHRVDHYYEMPQLYEIFEDFEMTELRELIEGGKLTSDPYKMFDLFKKIMSGVKAFADAGYIIRDLRPKTILVNTELIPVVSGLDYLGRKGEPAKKAYLKDNVAPEVLALDLKTPDKPAGEKPAGKTISGDKET